ncbi:unnamed protein product, partial [Sphacelaria rigidula]
MSLPPGDGDDEYPEPDVVDSGAVIDCPAAGNRGRFASGRQGRVHNDADTANESGGSEDSVEVRLLSKVAAIAAMTAAGTPSVRDNPARRLLPDRSKSLHSQRSFWSDTDDSKSDGMRQEDYAFDDQFDDTFDDESTDPAESRNFASGRKGDDDGGTGGDGSGDLSITSAAAEAVTASHTVSMPSVTWQRKGLGGVDSNCENASHSDGVERGAVGAAHRAQEKAAIACDTLTVAKSTHRHSATGRANNGGEKHVVDS